MRRQFLAIASALVMAVGFAPSAASATSVDSVVDWYETRSAQFFESLEGRAYTFSTEGSSAFRVISLRGSRDPRGAVRMDVKSPFLSGSLRCVNESRCWYRPAGERSWFALDQGDVQSEGAKLELSANDVRELLDGASVLSFDPDDGIAVLELKDQGQMTISITNRRLRLQAQGIVDGTETTAVSELRPTKKFRVKAPLKRLRAASDQDYTFTVPGLPDS